MKFFCLRFVNSARFDPSLFLPSDKSSLIFLYCKIFSSSLQWTKSRKIVQWKNMYECSDCTITSNQLLLKFFFASAVWLPYIALFISSFSPQCEPEGYRITENSKRSCNIRPQNWDFFFASDIPKRGFHIYHLPRRLFLWIKDIHWTSKSFMNGDFVTSCNSFSPADAMLDGAGRKCVIFPGHYCFHGKFWRAILLLLLKNYYELLGTHTNSNTVGQKV